MKLASAQRTPDILSRATILSQLSQSKSIQAMSPAASRRSSLKEKPAARKSSNASTLCSSNQSADIATLAKVPVVVRTSSISGSTKRRESIASEKPVKPAQEKPAKNKQIHGQKKSTAAADAKDPFNEPVPGLGKRQHERAVECLARLLEGNPIPQTRYIKQRSIYYSKMDLIKLVGRLTQYNHLNHFLAGGMYLRSAWTWVSPEADILLALREYLRRGCDPEYFTSGAGAGCVVS